MTRPAPHAVSMVPRRPLRRSRATAAGLLAGAALALALALAPRPAAAQSKSDAFAGRIPPVSAGLFRKEGRFELTPTLNLSVNDAFYSKYFGGLKLGYHFTESLSAGAFAAGGIDTKAGSAQVCPSNGGCHSASRTQMYQVPGNIQLLSGVEAAWAPVYGKLNVFSEKVAHFDLAVLGGLDYLRLQKVVSASDAEALQLSGGHPGIQSTVGAHLGLGVRVWMSEWMAARLEFRDYLYRVAVPNRGSGKDLQNQLFVELGVSFFLPTSNRPLQ